MDNRSKGVLMVIGGVVFGVLMLGAGVIWFGGAFVVIRGLMLIFAPAPHRRPIRALDISERPGPYNAIGQYNTMQPYEPPAPNYSIGQAIDAAGPAAQQ